MASKAFSLMIAGILSCSYANSLENKEKITHNGVSIYLEPNSKDKQRILNGEFDKTLEKMKKAFNANSKTPAPPVTYADVVQIKSQKDGTEDLQEGQSITKYDHGGSSFTAKTGVLGYGGCSSDNATFGGSKVECIESNELDINNDTIIDGWWLTWDLTSAPNESGLFIYTSRSINPGPTLSTSIQIQ